MTSKKKQLKQKCDVLGINYNSNDTIEDLENYINWYKNLQPKFSVGEFCNYKGLSQRYQYSLSKKYGDKKMVLKEWEEELDGIM